MDFLRVWSCVRRSGIQGDQTVIHIIKIEIEIGVFGIGTCAFCDDLCDFGLAFFHHCLIALSDGSPAGDTLAGLIDHIRRYAWGEDRRCCQSQWLNIMTGRNAYVGWQRLTGGTSRSYRSRAGGWGVEEESLWHVS